MRERTLNLAIWILIIVATIALYIGRVFHALPTTDLEIIGFITGIASVRWAAQTHAWTWPIGIVNSVAFFFLFVPAGLYANVLLQAIYVGQGIWGWNKWLKKEQVTYTPQALLVSLLIVMLPATLVSMGVFHVLSWQLPFWDTLSAVVSIIANYLLGVKRIENWYMWIAIDVVYVLIFITQGLYLTSLLYVLFLLQCIAGVRLWKQQIVPATT
jgi:nicotinamide mononucleotide transporter